MAPVTTFAGLQVGNVTVHPNSISSPLSHSLVCASRVRLGCFRGSFIVSFSAFSCSKAGDAGCACQLSGCSGR